MRYALGNLQVDDSHEHELLMMAMLRESGLASAEGGGQGRQERKIWMYQRRLQLDDLQRRFAAQRCEGPPPDLLKALPRGEADRGWLQGLHDVLAGLTDRRYRSVLTCCDVEGDPDGGTLNIAVVHRKFRGEIRSGDVVHGGFVATSRNLGEVRLAPRLYRVLCTNGSIVELGQDEEQVHTAETVVAAAQDCLSGTVFQGAVERLRLVADIGVRDPEKLLLQAHAASPWPRVRGEYERAADRTVWGLINAVTASARFARTWAERLHRERDAAAILALLERSPARHPRPGHPDRPQLLAVAEDDGSSLVEEEALALR